MLASMTLGPWRSARRRTLSSWRPAPRAPSASGRARRDSSTSTPSCRAVPSQNTAVPHNEFVARSARHDQIVAGLGDVDVKLQKLLAELVMMRLFDELQ